MINHHLLGIHHVRSGPNQLWWDLGFLALGVLLVVGGWLLARNAGRLDAGGERGRPAALTPVPTLQPTPGALAALLALLVYLAAARRARHTGPGWSHGRTLAFAAGALLLAYALADPAEGFAAHMRQHLLIGMLAPLGLVLGAPLTLLLRTVDARTGRRVVRLLRSRPARVLSHPVTGLLLTAGGLWVLYLTPLYRATGTYPLACTTWCTCTSWPPATSSPGRSPGRTPARTGPACRSGWSCSAPRSSPTPPAPS